MKKRAHRFIQIILLFTTCCVVATSFYFEYAVGLKPCPLCLMQRYCTMLLGMFCLMGIYASTLKRARLVAIWQVLLTVAGLYFSGRQLWLQSLSAEQAPACMPELDIMMKYFPWQDTARLLLFGAGDCVEVNWSWLGVSMPGWVFCFFAVMSIACGFLWWQLSKTYRMLTGNHRTPWL